MFRIRFRVIVTALLLAPLLAGCSKKNTDDDDAPILRRDQARAPSAASGSAATAAPASDKAPAAARNITADCVESARASSEDRKHPAMHAFDERPTTAWNESAGGDGAGEWVEAKLRPGTYVSYVEVGGGWSATSQPGNVDLWEHNNSFRKMKVTWDQGSAEVTFDRSTDRGKKKRVEVKAPTTALRFSAIEVDRGRFNDLCLDDVLIYGEYDGPKGPVDECKDVTSTCASDLFVQLASPLPSAPADYDYPHTHKLLAGRKEFSGTRFVETYKNGNRVMGAIVKNRCYADKLMKVHDEALKSRPQASCERIDVRRVIFEIP